MHAWLIFILNFCAFANEPCAPDLVASVSTLNHSGYIVVFMYSTTTANVFLHHRGRAVTEPEVLASVIPEDVITDLINGPHAGEARSLGVARDADGSLHYRVVFTDPNPVVRAQTFRKFKRLVTHRLRKAVS